MNVHTKFIFIFFLSSVIPQLTHGMEDKPSTSTGVMEDTHTIESQRQSPSDLTKMVFGMLGKNVSDYSSAQLNLIEQEPYVPIPSHQELRKRLTGERLQLDHFLKHTILLEELDGPKLCPTAGLLRVNYALKQYAAWLDNHSFNVNKGWEDIKESIADLTTQCKTSILREIYEEHPEALNFLYSLELIEDPYSSTYDEISKLTQERVSKLKQKEEWEKILEQTEQLIKIGLINNITEITSKQVNILKQEPCVPIPSHQELRKRLTGERLQLDHFLEHTNFLKELDGPKLRPTASLLRVNYALEQYTTWMDNYSLNLVNKGWEDIKELMEYHIIAHLTTQCKTSILREIYEENPEALNFLYSLELIEDPYGSTYDEISKLTQERVSKLKQREEWEKEMVKCDQEFLEYEQSL